MAMKKAAPKGDAKFAQGYRLSKQASAIRTQKGKADYAASARLERDARLRNMPTGYYEEGFNSPGLQKKTNQANAKRNALKAKTASQQMKQGVTKSGGYAGSEYAVGKARNVKSAKFKAEQAVKKTGSMTRNAGNKKRNAK
jgi:hypothetical protein